MMRTIYNVSMLTLVAWMALMLVGCSSYGGRAVKVSPTGSGPGATISDDQPDDTKTDFPEESLSSGDVKIKLKVKSKQCFGSGFGCNVVVEPDVTVLEDPGEDQTYEITFKVYGDESGPVIETIKMTGDQVSITEIFLSTAGSSTKIYAKVTDVEKWAY